MEQKTSESGWAICGHLGLYTGWRFTRREVIDSHTKAKGQTWEQCRRQGDRAVKVRVEVTG